MKTKFVTVQEVINGADCPLPLEVIPNQMGINLCAVEGITFTEQDDKQLVSVIIHFTPESK
jgi:hypothetical protein